MKDALLEIGLENLPARFVAPALSQMEDAAKRLLGEARLSYKELKTFGTYRRLALLVEGLEERSADMEKEAFGPPAKLLKGEDGCFTQQSAGFARSQGVPPEELYTVKLPKGEFIAAKKVIKGEPAAKILASVFPSVAASLHFPKTMVWEETQFRFARPIRSLIGLYGKKTVPFVLAGVKSSNKAPGLAASGGPAIMISEPAVYIAKLRDKCVITDSGERRRIIESAVPAAAARMGYKAVLDEALLDETVYLTEHPVPVAGNFAVRFLKLPHELLATVLKKQLKFFPVANEAGALQPHFVAVRDGISDNQAEVRRGYESVIEARLSDAVFFFEKDCAGTLEAMLERLKGVVFQERMGTLYKKSERVERLALWLCERVRQDYHLDEAACAEAAKLAYADLTSEVVREFPELQGYMGARYAELGGKSEKVAMGIAEFYYPLSPKAPVPVTLEGAIASLAGKLDTLAANFAAGAVPSGSEDPLGLRRQAAGVVRILLEKRIPLSVLEIADKALEFAAQDYAGQFDRQETAAKLEEFIWQRAETLLEEKKFKLDEIKAVRGAQLGAGGRVVKSVALIESLARLVALSNIRKNADFGAIAGSFKRVSNIIRQAGARVVSAQIDESLFAGLSGAETELYVKYKAVACKINPYLAGSFQADHSVFSAALEEMVSIRPFLDKFFEEVMVMDDNPKIRQNRLALLCEIKDLFDTVADLSQLQC